MNFNFPLDFKKIDFNIVTLGLGIYLIALGIIYYCIFHKHHKRNKVELDELISLITKFYTLTTFSIIAIIIGIVCIINANQFKDTRSDVITAVFLGIIIITIAIINYVFYIKRNLKDLEQEQREAAKKHIAKVGEILQLIFFIIFILMPIWRIPVFIEVIENKKELIIELVRSFGLSIASIILLNSINPVDIKGKIKNIFTNKKLK